MCSLYDDPTTYDEDRIEPYAERCPKCDQRMREGEWSVQVDGDGTMTLVHYDCEA